MRNFFLILFLLNLASCGFQTIYRDEESNISYAEDLAKIRIQKGPDRLNQELKNNLYDLLNPDYIKAEPKYLLEMNATKASSGTFVTQTGASGRNRVTVNVYYTLRNVENGMIISKGTTSVFDNYDVSTNRYGTYVADEAVQLNLTKIAAQNIRNVLVSDLIEAKKKCAGEPSSNDEVYDEVMVQDERRQMVKRYIKREFVCPFGVPGKPIKFNDQGGIFDHEEQQQKPTQSNSNNQLLNDQTFE